MELLQEKKPKLSKTIEEIFSIPVDLFDFFFLKNWGVFHFFFLYFCFAGLACISKLSFNYIKLKFFPEGASYKLAEGIILAFVLVVLGFFWSLFLEIFSKNFLQRLGKEYKLNSAFIAFLPLASSAVFFILPKPFFILGFLLGFCVGAYNFYEGLKNIYELNLKQILSFVFMLGIFLGVLSFVILFAFNLYRNS